MKCLLVLLYSFLFAGHKTVLVERWVIQKNSSLSIEGKSNVSSFKCDITEYLNPDTLFLYRSTSSDQNMIQTKGGLKININRFDCHQHYVTADLKKTLRASENAIMKVNLLSLGNIQQNVPRQSIRGQVEIQLAGVTKTIDVEYAVLHQSGILQLTGRKQLMFSDFKLSPPRKLAGMIKVDQEIRVEFRLFLRHLN